jgi:hypothetical protein
LDVIFPFKGKCCFLMFSIVYHGFQHLEVQAIAFLMDSPFGHWLMAV